MIKCFKEARNGGSRHLFRQEAEIGADHTQTSARSKILLSGHTHVVQMMPWGINNRFLTEGPHCITSMLGSLSAEAPQHIGLICFGENIATPIITHVHIYLIPSTQLDD